jgi:hypothetical protein
MRSNSFWDIYENHNRAVATIALVASLTGCQSLRYGGAPEPSFNVDKDLEQLAKEYGEAASITDFYKNPTKEARDKFICGRLVMMNIRYIQFIRKTTSEKQLLDSAVEILALSLNLAGASVSAAGTKTVLAAIAAGVTGSKVVVDKNYYYEKTIPALIAAMNAQRKQALVPIVGGMAKSLDEYPFAQAVTDLQSYYFAGTFLGAITAIQADASVKEKQHDEAIDKIRATLTVLPQGSVVTKQLLTDTIGKLKAEDFDKVKAALSSLDPAKYKDMQPTTMDDAKVQLQSYVREARTPQRVDEVGAAFKKAKLIE